MSWVNMANIYEKRVIQNFIKTLLGMNYGYDFF